MLTEERFQETLRARFAEKETMERLLRTVLPHLRAGKRTLVYILAQVERIGHAAMEPFFVKTLYGDRYERILLLTGEGGGPGYNPFILRCAGPQFVHVRVADPVLAMLGFLDGGLLDLKRFDLCLASPQKLIRDFGRHVVAGGALRHFELPEGISRTGEAFLAAVGQPPGAPFVTLHVRDMGYLPGKTHHAFRCADIATYGPAIRRFRDAGYRVFLLGSRQGTLPSLDGGGDGDGEAVIDVPKHPAYSQALDVFLSARCAFAFNQASGPEALVRAFGRPAATVNLVYELLRLPLRGDLLLFKDYVRAENGARLSYGEILARGLPAVGDGAALEKQAVAVRDNTPEELEAAADLMIASASSRSSSSGGGGAPAPVDSRALADFRRLGMAYEARLRADPAMVRNNHDFYAHAHGFGIPAPSVLARKGYLDPA